LIREIKEKNPEIQEIYVNIDEVIAFYETEYIMKIYMRSLEVIINKVEKKIEIFPLCVGE
jgi:hypothetical protein